VTCDFSRPGEDGRLPGGFQEFRQDGGAVCGRDEPSAEALRAPFVEQLRAAHERGPGWDELYNEFDLLPSDRSIVSLSYGEYVSPSVVLDFEPIVRRAEQRARFQHDSLEDHDRADEFRIIRRAWQCLETGKPSQPLLAHVDIFFEGVSRGYTAAAPA
jgi:hypothetical protein